MVAAVVVVRLLAVLRHQQKVRRPSVLAGAGAGAVAVAVAALAEAEAEAEAVALDHRLTEPQVYFLSGGFLLCAIWLCRCHLCEGRVAQVQMAAHQMMRALGRPKLAPRPLQQPWPSMAPQKRQLPGLGQPPDVVAGHEGLALAKGKPNKTNMRVTSLMASSLMRPQTLQRRMQIKKRIPPRKATTSRLGR